MRGSLGSTAFILPAETSGLLCAPEDKVREDQDSFVSHVLDAHLRRAGLRIESMSHDEL